MARRPDRLLLRLPGCAALRRSGQASQSHAHGRAAGSGRRSHRGLLAEDQMLRRVADRARCTSGLRLNYILLKEAARKGAEAIVTICPLCQFNLDVYQAEIAKQSGEKLDMPVLYFTQVLGWALGGDPRALGLQRSISGGPHPSNSGFAAHEGGCGLCLTRTARFESAFMSAIAAPTSRRRGLQGGGRVRGQRCLASWLPATTSTCARTLGRN